MQNGRVYAISISPQRGQLKKEIPAVRVITNYGLEHDGHAGYGERQVSCLDEKSVLETNRKYGLNCGPGDFAENLLLEGLDFSRLQVGSRLTIAGSVVLEVTQLGKEDHPSIVSRTFGVSLLPHEGLFCRVVSGGIIRKGDPVEAE
ncbi:MAG TPA: MOSC domain-containing protein [Firmicutes bacterium]|nr:MOSC domain-containing protein [Bacillota bacterium]